MKKVHFLQSIHVKIVIIYVLLILVAMQVIGVYFTRQLEDQLVTNFFEMIDDRADLLSYNVEQEMIADRDDDDPSLQASIDSLLNEFFNIEQAKAQVIDENNVVVSTSDFTERHIVGQRTTNVLVKRALVGTPDEDIVREPQTGHRMRVLATPVSSEDQTIGAIYIQASMEEIYDEMQQINQILMTGTMIALGITALLGILLSRTITRPIVDMKRQTVSLGEGDYSRNVTVYGADEIGQLATSFNDLSDKLQDAQATTEEERRKLSSVLANMTDGVMATDRGGRVILMNRRAEEILNTTNEEGIEYPITDLLHIEGVTIEDMYQMDEPLLLDFSGIDQEFVVEANISTVTQENGEKNGLIVVLHDVTEQEKVEQERREFVANVSHELRTPLTSMKSYLEALDDGALYDPEIAPRFLHVTQNETERMIRLVNDLLQLSKMDSKDYQINEKTLDLVTFANQIVDRFEMSTKHASIQFKRKFPNKPVKVQADHDKLTQVFDNTISNAIKYSPEGGAVVCTIKQEAHRVVVSVRDEGVGIPKENIPYIFDRFYRVDKARARSLGGTGLGLAIAKEIVFAHGGSIWVSSDWGKGTTMFFSLPYDDGTVEEA
ncbi:cell wall metabolism sensor histidine kinase WalK [Texcoconibacillus texcoconensis]|uniref:histidine kinase n=1 Tax=Texcoconibacillus texcoconensis TaxID=1095777 RepID=A0A840QTQ7_9BACI|nr:cell wall metabolism sensor histidine kinase WalK [Texcoconibacillus texcoconensis]MBB5174755.1 two-component system sensor histidine kinase VicK [Texcoconibacillus texcoconensis]